MNSETFSIITTILPEWVEPSKLKKENLLALPVGSPRPSARTSLGIALCHYIQKPRPNQRSSYDAEFDKAIRSRHPSWFIDATIENKKKLLALQVGSPLPLARTRLGGAFRRYIKNDLNFRKAIKAKHFAWFIDTVEENKKMLLAMPTGGRRPKLQCIVSYTCEGHDCYDPEFNQKIRRRQPQWFEPSSAKKKKEILKLKIGCKRPHQTKHPLGSPLCCYTNKKHGAYDPDFNKTIRSRQPGWFE